ncbi:flagellar biosynthesis anti-sigma factor FlgM [Paenibacillus oenotherae]|uniref:Negative regulator of flagellin synthesis n=1 Tax=Paenibacillus oenotherae TaxID=1435645 RepID=A0ABS7D4X8_9BACL|nr:flagellar biosynthesis anti-sigma factor FlgM [Paenibacillus oenotherae]MBW7474997.1 flagellar biosynthesis anti-sigma factor FlgM [Paenibacillus oenotherae]
MKINETQRIGGVNPYQKQNEQRAGGMGRKRQTDEVQISAEAQEMLSYSRASNAELSKRIEDLKESVRTGSYHVDSGKIAEKIWPFIK